MPEFSNVQVAELRRGLQTSEVARERAESKWDRLKSKTEEMSLRALQTVEVSGSAFAMSLINGKYANQITEGPDAGKWLPPEVMGIPMDLATGLALAVLGHTKIAKKASSHILNVADGALACFVVGFGREIGDEWRRKALEGGAQRAAPATLPAMSIPQMPAAAAAATAGYSDADIAMMAARGLR